MPRLKRVNGNFAIGVKCILMFPHCVIWHDRQRSIGLFFSNTETTAAIRPEGQIGILQPIGALEVFTSQSQEQCRGSSYYSYAI